MTPTYQVTNAAIGVSFVPCGLLIAAGGPLGEPSLYQQTAGDLPVVDRRRVGTSNPSGGGAVAGSSVVHP